MNNSNDGNLEQLLSGFAPKPVGLNRDSLCFKAGFAAGRRSVFPWQIGSGVLAGILACFLFVILHHPMGVRQPKPPAMVYVPDATPVPALPAEPSVLCFNPRMREALKSDDLTLQQLFPPPSSNGFVIQDNFDR